VSATTKRFVGTTILRTLGFPFCERLAPTSGLGSGFSVDLAGNIEIVCSARKAGVNHLTTGRCEWAGAIRDDRHVRHRGRSGPHIVKVEDPRGQTKFSRQLLDWAGTPTGQHWVQATSPRLRGRKTSGLSSVRVE
jgi:hypothetical protein